MPEQNGGRQKNVTGTGSGVHVNGQGLGTGPVGSGSARPGGSGRPQGPSSGGPAHSSGSGVTRGKGGLFPIIAIVAVLLLGGGGGLAGLLGGGGSSSGTNQSGSNDTNIVGSLMGGGSSSLNLGNLGSLISSGFGSNMLSTVSGTSKDWVTSKNTGSLNNDVSKEARNKYTSIKGGGKDTVTMMVYMCGTDLESKYGMATNDLNEMMKATISDKINIIVYTGGCSKWKTNGISTNTNQIYKVTSGRMTCLEDNMGNKAMTDPATLTGFIDYCSKNYKADRNILIFWDHGGGSLSGYGYDETHKSSGSMNLAGINTALKNAGIKYDFIGFDACLMATVETDLMLSAYADYVIASEETEPGVGWYYTNWLTALSKDTSMPTTQIGKMIIDDFVDECARTCAGQETTLSLVDLAELSKTIPDDFKAFSKSTTKLITDKKYETVSDARSGSREFNASSPIDQIDLVNFCLNMGTKEGKELADTLLGAVKYNRTSSNMTNAYGISIYFPYKKPSQGKLNSAEKVYDQIGLDDEYTKCIQEFAGVQSAGVTAGQANGGFGIDSLLGTSSGDTFSSLIDMFGSTSSGNSSGASGLLGLLGGQTPSGGSSSSSDLLGLFGSLIDTSGRALNNEDLAGYVSENMLDASKLTWSSDLDGKKYMHLDASDWALIHSVDLNIFVDDGKGYVDMGLDTLYSIDDYGNLIADTDGTWLHFDDQPVAFYHVDTTGNTIKGKVPALLNGERVNIIVLIDYNTGKARIAGAEPVYDQSVTETEFRGLVELKNGDKIDLICDYYDYDGNYQDSYRLGRQITVNGEINVSDKYLGEKFIGMYKLTDIYNGCYWTERFTK
ncbi:MAG: peptidase C11 [Lachnospiraceae bacterium]|nr:peptidase C11 [Lachnospiraceae bacterium]